MGQKAAEKSFLDEKPKRINLTKEFLYRALSFVFSQPIISECIAEKKITMMHFEAFLSCDDLLAI
jgi:hypothetical protein